MAKHRRRKTCKEQKKVISSSEKPGPSTTEASPEIDLNEDLALEDSDEDGGVIVEEDFIVL